MGLINWVERLRQKPEMARRRILVATSFSFTAVVFVLWVSIRFYDISAIAVSPSPVQKTDGPITQAGEAIGSFWENMRQDMASVGTLLASSTATSSMSEALATDSPELIPPEQ
jgi:hypothetical protein